MNLTETKQSAIELLNGLYRVITHQKLTISTREVTACVSLTPDMGWDIAYLLHHKYIKVIIWHESHVDVVVTPFGRELLREVGI